MTHQKQIDFPSHAAMQAALTAVGIHVAPDTIRAWTSGRNQAPTTAVMAISDQCDVDFRALAWSFIRRNELYWQRPTLLDG